MNTRENLTRRNFIKTASVGAAALAAAPAVLSAKSPNETIGVGCIGVGVRGCDLVIYIPYIKEARVAAICDVYKSHVQKGVERSRNPDVKTYVEPASATAQPDRALGPKSWDAVVVRSPPAPARHGLKAPIEAKSVR